jgi:hypothetical protein
MAAAQGRMTPFAERLPDDLPQVTIARPSEPMRQEKEAVGLVGHAGGGRLSGWANVVPICAWGPG